MSRFRVFARSVEFSFCLSRNTLSLKYLLEIWLSSAVKLGYRERSFLYLNDVLLLLLLETKRSSLSPVAEIVWKWNSTQLCGKIDGDMGTGVMERVLSLNRGQT